MKYILAVLALFLPVLSFAGDQTVVQNTSGSIIGRARVLKFSDGSVTNSSGTFTVSISSTVSNFAISSGGSLVLQGDSAKISFEGTGATTNIQPEPGNDVLLIGGSGAGFRLNSASSRIVFGGSNEVGLLRTGTAAMKITNGSSGAGTLLMAAPSATIAVLGATTPGLVGQLYYCSNCTTDAVCVSTGTTVGSFSRATSKTTACQ